MADNRHQILSQQYSTFGNKILAHCDVLNNIQSNKIFKPITIQIGPTANCDEGCSFCSVQLRNLKSYIPFSKIEKLLKDFRTLQAKSIELTGDGNPMLYRDNIEKKDINDIIELAHSLNFDIGIITNSVKLSKIKPENYNKINWIRVSLISLESGYGPEDYDFCGFPESKIGLSYIIYDGTEGTGTLKGKREYKPTSLQSFEKIVKLMELHPEIKFTRIAGDCLNKGSNIQVRDVYRPIIDAIDKAGKIFIKDIYDQDGPYNDGCYVGAIRPYITQSQYGNDPQVYICSSHVLNTKNYDLAYSLGSIDDVIGIWQRMNESYQKYGYPYEVKCNGGNNWESSCKFCYYYNNNKLLHTIANAGHMPDRNFP